ncbi:TrbC family F-type conjugative pilus assembly protein [Citrobacter freundii complex sp. 2022EL-00972]|uniref:TrbC family F-type conjugative pilus assembly protein n=1 Tax=Citrobacter freundii complex sp. 2022EL-00972 TaxID=2994609 RepID=UPI002245E39C|nr:TrbC family F-type conjugative pilus assembly protein [Citrobacter freundii complex sp. 2022EL-00972]MCX2460117.1 TrbC family F-type conjugative pilus assembly protein [Citrobacter freundii complex sp. 2022EL-00972]
MVKKDFYRITILAAAVFSSTAVFSNESMKPPTRPEISIPATSIPQRPAPLSEKDKLDLDELVKVAKKKRAEYEKKSRETAIANHKKIGEMPVPKSEHEFITDAVTGAITDADIADGEQNKIVGDFYYVLVSSSLSDDEIRNILSQYKNRKDVALVIRGVKDKKNILKELTHWQQLVLDSGSSTPINLDPTIFKSYSVTSVPTIIHEKDGKLVARVSGISNIAYMKDKQGDLGTAGPTKDISEISLLDIIEERIKNLDFDKMKNEALDNYWKKQKFENFPDALKRNQKTINPSVVIPQDILSPDGQVIAKKGRINPLEVIPFRLKLIFFDARSDWQRKIAKRENQNAKPGIQPILITTNVYGDGWQTFKDAGEIYGSRLYMIQPGMSERFGVTSLPSIVTSNGTQYVVDEYPKDEAEK